MAAPSALIRWRAQPVQVRGIAVHLRNKHSSSKTSFALGRLERAKLSTATDEGHATGVHTSKKTGMLTMAMADCS